MASDETLKSPVTVTPTGEQSTATSDPSPVQTPPVETPKEVVDKDTHHKIVSGFQAELQKSKEELKTANAKLKEAELRDLDEVERLRREKEDAEAKLRTYEEKDQRDANLKAYKDLVLSLLDSTKYPNAFKVLPKVMAGNVFPVQGETPEEIETQLASYEEALGGVVSSASSVNEPENPAHVVEKTILEKVQAGDYTGLTSDKIKDAMLTLAKESK